MEWIPANLRGLSFGGNNSSIYTLWFASDVNDYNLIAKTDDSLQQ
jgi:hypothetical protein